MLDVAWPELFVIGAVALVVIGPKDLPKTMFTIGKWVGKVRAWSGDIRGILDRLDFEAEMAKRDDLMRKTSAPVQEPVKKAEDADKAAAETTKAERHD